jgi:lysozyme
VDWHAVASEGWIRFAYVKATEGTSWVDPEFARNWAAARREGIRVGAYHYFGFCTPGLDQARHFLAVLQPYPDMLPPALDVESDASCPVCPSRAALLQEITAWCTAVEGATGKRPVVYVTDESYRSLLAGSGIANRLWFRDLFGEPRPAGGEEWAFWQWHSRGRIRGVAGIVDLNAYRSELGPFEGL